MHSGNVGHAQDLDNLIRATTFLRDLDDLRSVIVGFGARHAEHRRRSPSGSRRRRALPALPAARAARRSRSRRRTSTSSGSARASPATSSRAGCTASSRSARPVIVGGRRRERDGARSCEEAGCGLVIPPGRPDLLAQTLRELARAASTTWRRWGAGPRVRRAGGRPGVAIGRYRALLDEVAPVIVLAGALLGLARRARLDARRLPARASGCSPALGRRPVAAADWHAVGRRDRRRPRRGDRDRAADREPARARLPARAARDRRHLGRVDRRDRGARRGGRRARDPQPARRQGRGPGPRRARDRVRARRLLGRERDLGARRAAHARPAVRRSRRSPTSAASSGSQAADGSNKEGLYWRYEMAVRGGRVAARLGHRRQRLDLRGAPLRLRRGRSALRARPLAAVPDGAARPARGLRARARSRSRSRRRRTRPSTGARCGCSSTAG